MAVLVKIIEAADGSPTPHDGRWVVNWDPHTRYGVLDITSSINKVFARRFESSSQALIEWNTISNVQPVRPDGEYNRPLTAVTILVERDNEDKNTKH